jgi:hypothetical protein
MRVTEGISSTGTEIAKRPKHQISSSKSQTNWKSEIIKSPKRTVDRFDHLLFVLGVCL